MDTRGRVDLRSVLHAHHCPLAVEVSQNSLVVGEVGCTCGGHEHSDLSSTGVICIRRSNFMYVHAHCNYALCIRLHMHTCRYICAHAGEGAHLIANETQACARTDRCIPSRPCARAIPD